MKNNLHLLNLSLDLSNTKKGIKNNFLNNWTSLHLTVSKELRGYKLLFIRKVNLFQRSCLKFTMSWILQFWPVLIAVSNFIKFYSFIFAMQLKNSSLNFKTNHIFNFLFEWNLGEFYGVFFSSYLAWQSLNFKFYQLLHFFVPFWCMMLWWYSYDDVFKLRTLGKGTKASTFIVTEWHAFQVIDIHTTV